MSMNWGEWLRKRGMTSLKIKASFLELEFKPKDADKAAAWELYVELLTRTTTQRLDFESGDEQSALDSIYSIFKITRDVMKNHGSDCISFTKIAIVVLNQVVRPFTSKWHKLAMNNAFNDAEKCLEFRKELEELQKVLHQYTQMLANMADVEDLTTLEDY